MIHQFKSTMDLRVPCIRAFQMDSRWQTRTLKPAITSISVMLIVLVVLALFLRHSALDARTARFARAEPVVRYVPISTHFER